MLSTEDHKKIHHHAYEFSMKLAYNHVQLPPLPAAPSSTICESNLQSPSPGGIQTAAAAAAVVSFPLLGYRGSSLVSLNEVHAYLETCETIEDAVKNCGKLLNASR